MSLAKKKNWPWKAYNLEQETTKQINEMEKGKRLRQRLNAYDQRKCRQEEEPLSGPSQQNVWWRAAVTCLLYMKVLVQKEAFLTSRWLVLHGWLLWFFSDVHSGGTLSTLLLKSRRTPGHQDCDCPTWFSEHLFSFLFPLSWRRWHLVQHTFQDLDWEWVIVKKNISG